MTETPWNQPNAMPRACSGGGDELIAAAHAAFKGMNLRRSRPAQLLLYSCFPCIIDCDSIQSCGGLFRCSLQDAEAEP